jgi:hypothetical protein
MRSPNSAKFVEGDPMRAQPLALLQYDLLAAVGEKNIGDG